MFDWIQFFIGTILLITGIVVFSLQMLGMFRYKYILTRMHAAAMGDTLGILISIGGMIVMEGFTAASFKLVLIIVFLWFASPVSSHLIARLELITNQDKDKQYEVENNGDV